MSAGVRHSFLLGRHWCVNDCCGIVCVVFTWLLLLYGEFVVMAVMVLPAGDHAVHQTINGVLFQFFTLMAFVAHVRTMITDPGAVPRGNATDERIKRMGFEPGEVVYKCAKCCSIKPERAHHCSVCQRCIRKMDHHCPWVNNCIGEHNQKFFVLFTMYIALVSIHGFYWTVWQFYTCVTQNWDKCSSFSPPATSILLVFLLFEALLFSIFTAVMFGTQVHAICTDETGIEQLKGSSVTWQRHSKWKSLQAVMGGKMSINWFNPFVTPYVSKRPFELTV